MKQPIAPVLILATYVALLVTLLVASGTGFANFESFIYKWQTLIGSGFAAVTVFVLLHQLNEERSRHRQLIGLQLSPLLGALRDAKEYAFEMEQSAKDKEEVLRKPITFNAYWEMDADLVERLRETHAGQTITERAKALRRAVQMANESLNALRGSEDGVTRKQLDHYAAGVWGRALRLRVACETKIKELERDMGIG